MAASDSKPSLREALRRIPLSDFGDDPIGIHRRLLNLAKRGTAAPETLSREEVQQISYALEVHYAQLGLS